MPGRKRGSSATRTGIREPLRIYISSRWRRRFVLIGSGLAALAILFLGFGAGAADAVVGWATLGAAASIALVAVAFRTEAQECAFCHNPWRQANRLVAGFSAAICDQCASHTLALMLGVLERQGKTLDAVELLLRGLPPETPVDVSRALFKRALGESPAAARLRTLFVQALRLHADEAALDVLSGIPEAERTAQDWLNAGTCLGELGRTEEALAATGKAEELDPEGLRAWVLNNSTWYRLSGSDGIGPEALERCLADLEEARTLLRTDKSDWAKVALACCFGTEAEARRQAGDASGALDALDRADKVLAPTGARLLIRARAEAALGNAKAARRNAKRALAEARPESVTHQGARELLADLGGEASGKSAG